MLLNVAQCNVEIKQKFMKVAHHFHSVQFSSTIGYCQTYNDLG